jgi:hypothetical protein
MSQSRRDFIKFVVAGSVAAGCPVDAALLHVRDSGHSDAPRVDGEHFEICHQVRDGHSFERPAPTANRAIVIVGGGVAGLSAAYFLRGKDWLLLEKEDHFGGNAYQEEFDGQPFATGSAYAYRGDEGDQLASEMGLHLPLVNMPDPTLVNKTYVPDTWKTGIAQLPYPKEVVASFQKFRDDVLIGAPRRQILLLTSVFTTRTISLPAATPSAPSCPAGSAASPTSSSRFSSQNTKSACLATPPSSPSSRKKTPWMSPTSTKESSQPFRQEPS